MSQRYESTEPVRGRSRVPYFVSPFIGLLVTLLAWRQVGEAPEPGLDPSWQAALAMAAHSSLDWGTELVFTYGPLGWLRETRDWYTDTGGWGMAYVVATRIVLAGSLWLATRRYLGSLLALLVLLPVVWVVDDETTALGFVGAVTLVTAQLNARTELALTVALGCFSGFALLGKINAGVTVLVVSGLAVALCDRRHASTTKRVITWAGSAAATFVGLWLLTGQPLGALADYAHNGLRIISGYSQAMSAEYGSVNNYWLAGLVAAAGSYGIWRLVDVTSTRQRSALLLMWIAWCALYYKAAFVRHDNGHAFLFFAAAAPAIASLPFRRGCAASPTALVLLLLAPLCFKWSTGAPASTIVAPKAHLQAGKAQVSRLWNAPERESIQEAGRKATISAKPISPAMLSAIGGSTVAVQPAEATAAWAYGLNWDPLPVFQDYQAYTQGLDALNADKLLGKNAPEKILYRPDEPVDGRVPAFDSPATYRARMCRYQPVMVQRDWLLLRRDQYRCGEPRLVSTATVGWGQLVTVPRPSTADSIVFVRIAGAGVMGTERLRSMFFKAFDRQITMEPGTRVHRVVPGTLGSGLPISAGPRADLPEPYNVAPGAQAIQLSRSGAPSSTARLRFDFYEVRRYGLRGLSPTR